MTYCKKFVASVKCKGNILREQGDDVYLPFGSEYSLILKNLHSRKASVNVEIDGQDTIDGSLIIGPNETVELERFIEDNNLNRGHRFKFIEKTQEISDHRGDKVEDGLIRIEFTFEQEYPTYNFKHTVIKSDPYPYYPPFTFTGGVFSSDLSNIGSSVRGIKRSDEKCISENEVSCYNISSDVSKNLNDEGITVKGSESNQKFVQGHIGILDVSTTETIIFNLKGYTGELKVVKPITVKTKIKCSTCGKKNRSNNRYCSGCGTALFDANR